MAQTISRDIGKPASSLPRLQVSSLNETVIIQRLNIIHKCTFLHIAIFNHTLYNILDQLSNAQLDHLTFEFLNQRKIYQCGSVNAVKNTNFITR